MKNRPLLLIDFDGTVTCRDSELYVADRLLDDAGKRVLAELVADYEGLRIGLSEYYDRYFTLMDLERRQWQSLVEQVPWRADFPLFIQACRKRAVDVMILSEGLDLFIVPLLNEMALADIPLSCNRIDWARGRPRVVPAWDAVACDRCLNCKGVHARKFLDKGRSVGLIGNGASDLCAAREVKLTFARDQLACLCRQEGIAFVPWHDFADIDLDLIDL